MKKLIILIAILCSAQIAHATLHTAYLRQGRTGTHIYGSLSAAIAGEGHTLAADDTMLFVADSAWTAYDSVYADFSQATWGTEATAYVIIQAIDGARNTGIRDSTRYCLAVGPNSSSVMALRFDLPHLEIDGIQVQNYRDTESSSMVNFAYGQPASYSNKIHDCLFVGYSGGTYADRRAINADDGHTGTLRLWNCIFYGFTGYAGEAIKIQGTNSYYIYNNTFANGGRGMNLAASGGAAVLKNNIIYNMATAALVNATASSSDSNRTDASSWGGTVNGSGNATSITFTFINSGSGTLNWHLASNDDGAIGHAGNLSADANLAFTTDIDGNTRSAPWDVGADEYQGGITQPSPLSSCSLDSLHNYGVLDTPDLIKHNCNKPSQMADSLVTQWSESGYPAWDPASPNRMTRVYGSGSPGYYDTISYDGHEPYILYFRTWVLLEGASPETSTVCQGSRTFYAPEVHPSPLVYCAIDSISGRVDTAYFVFIFPNEAGNDSLYVRYGTSYGDSSVINLRLGYAQADTDSVKVAIVGSPTTTNRASAWVWDSYNGFSERCQATRTFHGTSGGNCDLTPVLDAQAVMQDSIDHISERLKLAYASLLAIRGWNPDDSTMLTKANVADSTAAANWFRDAFGDSLWLYLTQVGRIKSDSTLLQLLQRAGRNTSWAGLPTMVRDSVWAAAVRTMTSFAGLPTMIGDTASAKVWMSAIRSLTTFAGLPTAAGDTAAAAVWAAAIRTLSAATNITSSGQPIADSAGYPKAANVQGGVGGNISGSVNSIYGISFPSNFASLKISSGGYASINAGDALGQFGISSFLDTWWHNLAIRADSGNVGSIIADLAPVIAKIDSLRIGMGVMPGYTMVMTRGTTLDHVLIMNNARTDTVYDQYYKHGAVQINVFPPDSIGFRER